MHFTYGTSFTGALLTPLERINRKIQLNQIELRLIARKHTLLLHKMALEKASGVPSTVVSDEFVNLNARRVFLIKELERLDQAYVLCVVKC